MEKERCFEGKFSMFYIIQLKSAFFTRLLCALIRSRLCQALIDCSVSVTVPSSMSFERGGGGEEGRGCQRVYGSALRNQRPKFNAHPITSNDSTDLLYCFSFQKRSSRHCFEPLCTDTILTLQELLRSNATAISQESTSGNPFAGTFYTQLLIATRQVK